MSIKRFVFLAFLFPSVAFAQAPPAAAPTPPPDPVTQLATVWTNYQNSMSVTENSKTQFLGQLQSFATDYQNIKAERDRLRDENAKLMTERDAAKKTPDAPAATEPEKK